MTQQLEHAYENCTGTWMMKDRKILVCTQCSAEAPGTIILQQLAMHENHIGRLAMFLTKTGERFI